MADIIYFGILPPNLEIEIPYRALLPRGMEQILITGKALSCTHDALPAIRMQRDMQQLGGVVGLAAALTVKLGIIPRELPIDILKKRLVVDKVLPDRSYNDFLSGCSLANLASSNRPHYSNMNFADNQHFDFKEIIDSLTGDEPFEWLEMQWNESIKAVSPIVLLCFAEKERVIPLLINAFKGSQDRRQLLLARILLWHGQKEGLNEVMKEIENLFSKSSLLPKRIGSIRFTQMPPDHGVMPEIIYLINSLVRTNSREVIKVYCMLVDRIAKTKRDYNDIRAGIFNYIDIVAYAAERLVFPEFIPLLYRLINLPEFRYRRKTSGYETDILDERLSYLLFSLVRALARCGSNEGLFELVEFIHDSRMSLSRSAHDELVRITGKDYGFCYDEWRKELNGWLREFEPIPWTKMLE